MVGLRSMISNQERGAFLDIGIQKEMLLGEEDLPALKECLARNW